VHKLLITLLALLALAMGLSHATAMAAGSAAAVMTVEAESASADTACHGAAAKDRQPAGTNDSGQEAPDCCPDGCQGGCAMLAALPGAPAAALRDAQHGQTPLPVGARAPADRPHGLKRPPRTTA